MDSPLYLTLLSLFVYSLEQWNKSKMTFLKRLVVTAHARHLSPTGTSKYGLLTIFFYFSICGVFYIYIYEVCWMLFSDGKSNLKDC